MNDTINEDDIVYDMVTKAQIPRRDIRPNKPYILYSPSNKWKIRTAIFDDNLNIQETRFIRLEDERDIAQEIIREQLLQKGYKNVDVKYNEFIQVNDLMTVNIPVYTALLEDENGLQSKRGFDAKDFKPIYAADSRGNQSVYIENRTIDADVLITLAKSSISNSDNIRLHIDQFGVKGDYNLRNKDDIARLKEDLPRFPRKNPEEQMRTKRARINFTNYKKVYFYRLLNYMI